MARERDYHKEYEGRKRAEARRGHASPRQGYQARKKGVALPGDEVAKRQADKRAQEAAAKRKQQAAHKKAAVNRRQVFKLPDGRTMVTETAAGRGHKLIQQHLDRLAKGHMVDASVEVELAQGGTAVVSDSYPAWWFQPDFMAGLLAMIAAQYTGGSWDPTDIVPGSISFTY